MHISVLNPQEWSFVKSMSDAELSNELNALHVELKEIEGQLCIAA